jgi:hypothetical protein
MKNASGLVKNPLERLPLSELRGDGLRLGQQYGECYAGLIEGFYAQECSPNRKKLDYAAKCVPFIRRFAPDSYDFLRGMARAINFSYKAAALLMLHEELYHSRFNPSHCTAVVVPPDQSDTHSTYVAQNWDWQPQLAPWAGMLRLHWNRKPSTLTYHYPGLWSCCGINSAGLSLMWTGAGYFPPLRPQVGLPTYVITSEIMRRSSVAEALDFLRKVPRAGPFMFLLGDVGGQCAVVEATPGYMRVEDVRTAAYRANVYEFPDTIKRSRQVSDTRGLHSHGRLRGVARYLKQHQGPLSVRALKALLDLPAVRVHKPLKSVTVDQLIADCRERRLIVRRSSISAQHRWIKYSL